MILFYYQVIMYPCNFNYVAWYEAAETQKTYTHTNTANAITLPCDINN